MKRNLLTSVWAGFLLCTTGIMTAQASSTIITFSVDMATNLADGSFNPPPPAGTGTDAVSVFGSFNGYASPGLLLVQAGSSTVFTNSYNDTSDANGTTVAYRFLINGSAEPLSCYDNRAWYLPTNSGASLALPTPYYGGNGPVVSINVKFQVDMSEEIELGNFNPNLGNTVVVAGSLNGWGGALGNPTYALTNDPSILVTNNNFTPPVIESNVYTVTLPVTTCANPGTGSGGLAVTNEIQEWQFVEMPGGSWGGAGPANNDQSGNRFFLDNTNQTLPLVTFNDAVYAPLAKATLNVDMSGVISSDPNYIPNSVVVWGTFNGWANGINMTNNPAAPNANIYSTVLSVAEGSSVIYQVRYTNAAIHDFVYDFANDEVFNNNARRTLLLPITPTLLITNMPPIYFNDLSVGDYLPTATAVLFTVDMNGAVGTDSHVFNPDADGLYINGSFVNLGYPQAWYAWEDPTAPAVNPPGYQMIRVGATTIYTNTIMMPAGTPVPLSYQYGMDPNNSFGGPLQDEASGINHFRVVRSTTFNPYVMPTDTFTNMPYQEPFFSLANIWNVGNVAGGNLNVGAPVAGKVPVSWLGQPGANLQVGTSLVGGTWQNLPATSGTSWTAGYNNTTNGFTSVTNWPSSGNAFFRLVKP
jgi:hypothetical protein